MAEFEQSSKSAIYFVEHSFCFHFCNLVLSHDLNKSMYLLLWPQDLDLSLNPNFEMDGKLFFLNGV